MKDFLRCCCLIAGLCAAQLSLLSPMRWSLLSSSRQQTSQTSTSPEKRIEKEEWTFPISDSQQQQRNLSLLVAQYAAPLSFQRSRDDEDSSNTTTTTTTSGIVSTLYDELLQLTSPINQAYCRAWKCDYWLVRGIPFQSDGEELVIERVVVQGRINRTTTTRAATLSTTSDIPASRSTYNKVAILEMALLHNENVGNNDAAVTKYDRLLLLDADALLYDFSRDIAMAVPNDRVVTAHRTHHNTTTTNSGSINVGVTVWNLCHPLTALIVRHWKEMCLRRIRNHKHDDDQAPLQKLLKQLPDDERNRVVYAVADEFGYARGRWVRHYIRRSDAWQDDNNDNRTNSKNALRGDERKAQITQAVSEVCERYWPVCEPDENNRI